MDEPTTGLDPDTRAAVEETIAGLNCDVLVVAVHDPSPAFLARFDRVLTMKDGLLTQEIPAARSQVK